MICTYGKKRSVVRAERVKSLRAEGVAEVADRHVAPVADATLYIHKLQCTNENRPINPPRAPSLDACHNVVSQLEAVRRNDGCCQRSS